MPSFLPANKANNSKEKPKSAPLENAINAGNPDTRKDVA